MSKPVLGQSRIVGRGVCSYCGRPMAGEVWAWVSQYLEAGGYVDGVCRQRIDAASNSADRIGSEQVSIS